MRITKNVRNGLGLLILGLLMVVFMPVDGLTAVSGTTGGNQIENAKQPSGDTFPLNAGELSVSFQSTSGGDTSYADTSTTVQTTVDTGFDIGDISFPSSSQNVSAGDSLVLAVPVYNLSNNPGQIPFDVEHLDFSDSDTINDSFTLELFYETGNHAANDFDTTTVNRVNGSDGQIQFMEGETITIYPVITASSGGNPGDTVQSSLFVTDNAPIGPDGSNLAAVGDQWERGSVIGVEDTYDTQTDTFITTLQGSNIQLTKSFSLPNGSARPGDTIEYTITARNTGNVAADTVTLVDAFPDSTTYVGGSETLNLNGNSDQNRLGSGTGVGFDDDFNFGNGTNSTDGVTDGELAPAQVRIFWPLDQIAAGTEVVLTYRVQIE